MILIGSRGLGIHTDFSDYDYVAIDDVEGVEVWNERITPIHHCYHYPKDYRDRLARFVEDDWKWIFNAEDYMLGVIDVNPFDYKEAWISHLKTLDMFSELFYINGRPRKKTYHIVYNVESLKEGSVKLSERAIERVKLFHDGIASLEDYKTLISEINNLK